MAKVIIDIRDGISEEEAVHRVLHVIRKGRISKNGKLFCYVVSWEDGISVNTRDYRKNDCFVVYKNIRNE